MAPTQQSSLGALTKHKVKLVRWLSKDFQVILQNVQCEELVDERAYQRLKSTCTAAPELACIDLIDTLMNRGEGASYAFLQLLRDPDVYDAYNEQLKEWVFSLELLPPAGSGPTTPQNANTSHSVAGASAGAGQTSPQSTNISHSVTDLQLFFKENRAKLVSRVRNVGPIMDDLQSITCGIHNEMAASIHADPTSYRSMRSILDAVTNSKAREALFNSLLEHEAGVMHDLGYCKKDSHMSTL